MEAGRHRRPAPVLRGSEAYGSGEATGFAIVPDFIVSPFIEPDFIVPDFIVSPFIEPDFIVPLDIVPDFIEPDFIEPDFIEPDFIVPDFIEPGFIVPVCIVPLVVGLPAVPADVAGLAVVVWADAAIGRSAAAANPTATRR